MSTCLNITNLFLHVTSFDQNLGKHVSSENKSMIVEDGYPLDGAVANLVGRPLQPHVTERPIKTYGTAHCGFETMRHAWPTLEHRFSIGGYNPTETRRVPKTFLSNHPVDLLVVDCGETAKHRDQKSFGKDYWMDWVQGTPVDQQPVVVLESWPSSSTTWSRGPISKTKKTQWTELGYTSRYRWVDSEAHGGAIRQVRLIVARLHSTVAGQWSWAEVPDVSLSRPMSNLLTPWGLLPRHVKRNKNIPPHPNIANSTRDAMPNRVGSWIDTPEGVRRLQPDELARGLGCPSSEVKQLQSIPTSILQHTTSVFIWESLSPSLSFCPETSRAEIDLFNEWNRIDPTSEETFSVPRGPAQEVETSDAPPFTWIMPNLEPGGEWYTTRLRNLGKACAQYGCRAEGMFQEGLDILKIHRTNYDEEGPNLTRLQLLWWEFPREHWDPIREGSRIGFLTEPEAILHPNSDMDEAQLRVAAQYVDELVEIGVLRPSPNGKPPHTNTPLFCVPKPHQDNEWRVIADCKAGGQNRHIGADPVYLNRPLHILERMYSGGYTAVADGSKFFHQFSVHPFDQKYLGVLHPTTNKWYVWAGCPMGSGSSPGLANRYGLSFVRMLRERSKWFAGSARANCYWTKLQEQGYDPNLGYGFTLERADGKPAVLLWVFVDDFCIHGPDLESTSNALRDFLDLAVDVGLLIHPKKLYPPAQQQTYLGFIFDTRGSPVLRIPKEKSDRGLAMAKHVLSVPKDTPFSRLALSVVAGTLESLADATPNRMGHTHLVGTHGLIHKDNPEIGRPAYYSTCYITDTVRSEMKWWIHILSDTRGRSVRSARSSTLIPTWGDGSGTGTGGTIMLPDQPMHLWMGQWSPAVFHNSSNWKELKTLLLTLQQLAVKCPSDLEGTTVFYFTDNSASYYIVAGGSSRSPGLHKLIEQIQLILLDLRCHLEPVHVPGVVMIQQGTDGLSRGVWLSQLHPERDQTSLTKAVFDPLPPDMDLAHDYANALGVTLPLAYHDWHQAAGSRLFNHISVWFPPPELARQCLIGILEAWVERPRTTGALLFIPRTLARCWLGLSRHIRLVDTIFPAETPLQYPPVLPIPVMVLFLAPHVPSLPTCSGMGTSPKPKGYRWHDNEAARMRGLSSTDTPQ